METARLRLLRLPKFQNLSLVNPTITATKIAAISGPIKPETAILFFFNFVLISITLLCAVFHDSK
jgi:hypothetical protein